MLPFLVFWHKHSCYLFKWPKTRTEFWKQKLEKNLSNDEKTIESLKKLGWRILVIWECALKGKTQRDFDTIIGEIDAWLQSSNDFLEIAGLA
jgi:DNA mismatch endonuclease (patch repair protein)